MVRERVSRRQFVAVSGATVSTSLLAGCGESGPGAGNSPGENGSGGGAEDDETAATAGEEEENLVDLEPWRDVEAIELEGYTEAWEAVSPAPIEGDENPALVLIKGNEFTVTWTNGDGAPHDFTLWNQDQEEIDSTDTVEEEGEEASLTFEATEEIVQYVCTVHPDTMIGDVQVVAEDADGGGD